MDVKHTSEKQSLSKTMTEELIMSKTYNSFVDSATYREQASERERKASNCVFFLFEALPKQTDIINR